MESGGDRTSPRFGRAWYWGFHPQVPSDWSNTHLRTSLPPPSSDHFGHPVERGWLYPITVSMYWKQFSRQVLPTEALQSASSTSTIPHLLDPQSFLLPLPVLRWSRVQWARTSCWDSKKLTFLIPQLVMLRVYFPLALLCHPFHGSEGDWQPPEQKCFHYQWSSEMLKAISPQETLLSHLLMPSDLNRTHSQPHTWELGSPQDFPTRLGALSRCGLCPFLHQVGKWLPSECCLC